MLTIIKIPVYVECDEGEAGKCLETKVRKTSEMFK